MELIQGKSYKIKRVKKYFNGEHNPNGSWKKKQKTIWVDGIYIGTNGSYSFSKDGYKITKNIRRWMIEYQAPVVDENGKAVFDDDGFPVYEMMEFDIRGETYRDALLAHN